MDAADAERRKLAAAQPRVEHVPRRPRPSAAAPPAASYPLPARRLLCSLRAGLLATELAGWSTLPRDWRALWRTLVAPDWNSERESRECEALEERAMGLEPTTLSLGSARRAAWLSRFPTTEPKAGRCQVGPPCCSPLLASGAIRLCRHSASAVTRDNALSWRHRRACHRDESRREHATGSGRGQRRHPAPIPARWQSRQRCIPR